MVRETVGAQVTDRNPDDVTLNTLHEDLTVGFADLKDGMRAGFADLKVTLVTGFQSLPSRESSDEMVRDRKSTRLNSSHSRASRMPSSA